MGDNSTEGLREIRNCGGAGEGLGVPSPHIVTQSSSKRDIEWMKFNLSIVNDCFIACFFLFLSDFLANLGDFFVL